VEQGHNPLIQQPRQSQISHELVVLKENLLDPELRDLKVLRLALSMVDDAVLQMKQLIQRLQQEALMLLLKQLVLLEMRLKVVMLLLFWQMLHPMLESVEARVLPRAHQVRPVRLMV